MQDTTKTNSKQKPKPGFVLYKDLYHTVIELNNEKAGKLLKIILAHVNENPIHIDDDTVKIAWIPIKLQLDRDLQKYQDKCAINQANAEKRWSKNNANASKRKKGSANASNCINGNANNAHTDIDSDIDTDIDSNNIDDVFSSYLETIQSDKESVWRNSIYKNFKLTKGSLKKLLEEFKLSQLSEGKETLDGTLMEFKKHFRNWLNKIDNLGKLEKYKNLKNRKEFGL